MPATKKAAPRKRPVKKKELSPLEELQQHQDKIAACKARVIELKSQLRRSKETPKQAVAALEAYYEELGQGAEPDDDREAKLKAALYAADSDMATRTVPNHDEAEVPYRIELVNRKVHAMLRGAERALAVAEDEYSMFVVGRFDDLAAAIADEARQVVDHYQEAWDSLTELDAEWRQVRSLWRPLIERSSSLTHEFPDPPLGTSGKRKLRPAVPLALLDQS